MDVMPADKLAPPSRSAPLNEIGVAGLKVNSGRLMEEYLRSLQGPLGMQVYARMRDDDATVGALLLAVDLLCRAVEWRVEAAPDGGTEAEDHADFARSIMEDMSHTWEDFISEALTMLVFGWSFFEIVAKRRVGPDEVDPSRRSVFDDGRIGIRKLAPRAQVTLHHWEIQDDGGIAGMWQSARSGTPVFLPIERCLLFRTSTRNNNPEGRSILRNAYRSWFNMKTLEDVEAIGHERELAGLPVVSIPSQYLTSADPADVQVRLQYEKIARDLKFNEQGGLVIPSDVYPDADGKPSSNPLVKVQLLSTAGSRTMDPDKTIRRYQANIARSALADFLMLGTDSSGRGSFALSSDKSSVFLNAVQTFLDLIGAVWNRHALPRLWAWNGLDLALLPRTLPAQVKPPDLGALGAFLVQLSQAGATLWPDPDLDRHVRALAGLPEPKEEALDLRDRQHEAGVAAMEQGVAQGSNAAGAAKPDEGDGADG
jgi:hypothetical protein